MTSTDNMHDNHNTRCLAMLNGQCLCGAQRFEAEGKLEFNHHCHCGYCRKHHGSAYSSFVGVAADRFRWERGELIRYNSSADLVRESCATCGSAMPQALEGLPIFVPASLLGDFEATFDFHIFAASKAPWHEIADGLPTFDAYPPGVESAAQETRQALDPPGGTRGSCLCGDVRYVIDGAALAARHCHCTRCQRGRAAAHASNLIVPLDSLRFTAGAEAIRRYKVPEAQYFTQSFCARCGCKAPTLDPGRKIAVVPLGGLDDPPPLSPQEHIWTADVPAWGGIHDALPQFEGPPN
jgi:hypothetical protein